MADALQKRTNGRWLSESASLSPDRRQGFFTRDWGRFCRWEARAFARGGKRDCEGEMTGRHRDSSFHRLGQPASINSSGSKMVGRVVLGVLVRSRRSRASLRLLKPFFLFARPGGRCCGKPPACSMRSGGTPLTPVWLRPGKGISKR